MRNDILTVLIFGALGLAGYAAWKSHEGTKKIDEISERIDKTVDDISKGIEISVDEPIIKEAVEKAVDREVRNQVKTTCETAVHEVEKDIRKDVAKAVNDKLESIEDDVEEEIKKQIGDIDISKAKNQVVKEASDKAAAKFNGELNDILGHYKNTLSNVSKIYQSISDAVAKPATQGINPSGSSPVILKI